MFKIADPATRFCSQALKAAGDRWDASNQVWRFRSVDDAIDGLYALYGAMRASAAQREMLSSLIEEGIGAQAWEIDLDGMDHASWIASLSREEASRLITQALTAMKGAVVRLRTDVLRSKTTALIRAPSSEVPRPAGPVCAVRQPSGCPLLGDG